jgi:hypothetical protein
LVEAKRIREGRFQEEQLAREFVAVTSEAAGRTPLLLLIIPARPPVPVAKLGRVTIEDAIAARLDSVLARTDAETPTADLLLQRIDETVAWITWPQLAETVRDARSRLHVEHPSVDAAITRLSDFLAAAIRRHS